MAYSPPSLADLLLGWFEENFSKYKILSIQQLDPSTRRDNMTHELVCKPCHAQILLRCDPAGMTLISQKSMNFQIADPSFSFDEAFGALINGHLYHHQLGPIYASGWLPKGKDILQ